MGDVDVLHEGTLEVLLPEEGWTTRFLEVLPGRLQWYKAEREPSEDEDDSVEEDDSRGEVSGEVHLDERTDIRAMRFGLKKFMFELTSGDLELKLAASGEAEKLDWIQALEAGAGLEDTMQQHKHIASARAPSFVDLQKRFTVNPMSLGAASDNLEAIISSIGTKSSKKRESKRKSKRRSQREKEEAAADAAAAELAAATEADSEDAPKDSEEDIEVNQEAPDSPVTPSSLTKGSSWIKKNTLDVQPAASVAQMTAAERIQEKLQGNVSFATTKPTCAVCGKRVYGIEAITVNGRKMHKTCFTCSVCGTRLNPSNYSQIGDALYCREHYLAELRSKRSEQAANSRNSAMRNSAMRNSAMRNSALRASALRASAARNSAARSSAGRTSTRRKSLKEKANSVFRRMSRSRDTSKPLETMEPLPEESDVEPEVLATTKEEEEDITSDHDDAVAADSDSNEKVSTADDSDEDDDKKDHSDSEDDDDDDKKKANSATVSDDDDIDNDKEKATDSDDESDHAKSDDEDDKKQYVSDEDDKAENDSEIDRADEDSDAEKEEEEPVPEPKRVSLAKKPGRLSNSRLASVRIISFRAPSLKRESSRRAEEDDAEEEDHDAGSDEEDNDVSVPVSRPTPRSVQRDFYDASEDDEESSPPMEHLALHRPMVRRPNRRRPPTAVAMASETNMTPTKNKQARMVSGLTFLLDDGHGNVITMYTASASERDQWVQRLASALYVQELQVKLVKAQRKDMLSSLQAKADLDNYQKSAELDYEGFVEVLTGGVMAKATGKSLSWKKRYCVLNRDSFCIYTSDAKGKKPSKTVRFNPDCTVLDVHHRILRPIL